MKPENAPSGQEIPGSHAAHEHRPVSHSPTEEIRPNHYGAIGIQPAGESGRSGFHPVKFLKIIWHSNTKASRLCNVLWPVVPAAVTVTYSRTDLHLAIFVLNYLAMVPCANLIGFAGQELARKVHKVFGVIMETTLGSVVEIVLFMTLCQKGEYEVIKAAILGSVLATQLLCLGLCFFVGGIRHEELEFNEAVGEVGSDLLLTACVVLSSALNLANREKEDSASLYLLRSIRRYLPKATSAKKNLTRKSLSSPVGPQFSSS